MEKVSLLIIDPQYDFCNPAGTLFVPGAEADMERLGKFITANAHKLADIQVTLDSHHLVDIAHPCSWVDSHGKHPTPFTTITANDVRTGTWRAFYSGWQTYFEEYTQKLEDGKRYPLMIWPPHCLIGSVGATIVKPVLDGILAFEGRYRVAGKTTKGSNPMTEHYSAVKAEVEDPTDVTTKINTVLIETLNKYDKIILSGEALDYCLANTVTDIINTFSPDDVKKMYLLRDCTSSVVAGGEGEKKFLEFFVNAGGTITTSDKFVF